MKRTGSACLNLPTRMKVQGSSFLHTRGIYFSKRSRGLFMKMLWCIWKVKRGRDLHWLWLTMINYFWDSPNYHPCVAVQGLDTNAKKLIQVNLFQSLKNIWSGDWQQQQRNIYVARIRYNIERVRFFLVSSDFIFLF